MWKKDSAQSDEPGTSASQASPRSERPAPSRSSGERATIGRSITIKGEVTGDEDLVIQGRIDGSVNLKQHAVTVGPEGEVKASIVGRIVTIEGQVEGDLTAEEQVVLRSSSKVQGDITAPRVVLEDGARFRGGVDMGQSADRGRDARSGASSAPSGASAAPSGARSGSASVTGSSGASGSSSDRTSEAKGADDAAASSDKGSASGGKGASDPVAKVTS